MHSWQNRITRYSDEAPDQLLANPRNWRTHPDSQVSALRGVLADVGWVQNVIANERTGHLIDGHLRVMEAMKSGQAAIPVTWVNVSEEEEALILATLDPLAAMAGTDAAQLDALLRDVSTDSPAVQAMLDELATEAGIIEGVSPDDLWKGMPEFEQEDLDSWKSIHVHFANEQDYGLFARLVEQALTPQTRSIWYPYKEKNRHIDNQVEDES